MRTPGNLDFCRPDLISFKFLSGENFVVIEETTTGVVCRKGVDGFLLRIEVGTEGFNVVFDN